MISVIANALWSVIRECSPPLESRTAEGNSLCREVGEWVWGSKQQMALVVFSRCSFTYFGHNLHCLSPSKATCSGLNVHLDQKLCDLLKNELNFQVLGLIYDAGPYAKYMHSLKMMLKLCEYPSSQPDFLVIIFLQRLKGINGKLCLGGLGFHHKSLIF